MKGECMSKFDNELLMCEGNYVVERDYEWCPICLGTGVKQEKKYDVRCYHCNGSQDSALGLFGYVPGGKDWNTYYNRNDKLVKLPEALESIV
tara:strand:- start:129 stop:404 length:276 start_codon:yes stop_codon:yes gene_type:complete